MKTSFLRLLPYLIALAIGVLLYLVADNHIEDGSLNGLMMNISAGLLSVPMVFICYEIVKQRCDKTVNESISDHLYFELNHHVVNIMLTVGKLIQVDRIDDETLIKYTQMHKDALKKQIHPNPELATSFNTQRNAINNIIRNTKSLDVMADHDIHTILQISKQAGMIANELQYTKIQETQNQLTDSVAAMISFISKWADSQEENFLKHHSLKLAKQEFI